MINGGKDLKHWKSVSKRLLLTVISRGHLPTRSLSAYAKWALAEHMEEPTSYSYRPYPYQIALKKSDEERALRRARAFSAYSNKDLARMDCQGIKILGIDYDHDHTNTDWAIGITHED